MDIPTEAPEGWRWAWFSEKAQRQDKGIGSRVAYDCLWDGRKSISMPRTVHPLRYFGCLEDGTEVEYNFLTDGPEHGTGWGDIVFVGLVRPEGRRHQRLIPGSDEVLKTDFKLPSGTETSFLAAPDGQ